MRSLSRLGPLAQIAYVVEDLDAAMAYWTVVMNVGPFFVRLRVELDDIRYRGAPTRFAFDMALAYWGSIQIELIRCHGEGPSIFADWTAAGHQGVQHVGVFVEDIVEARSLVAQAGATIVQEVFMGARGEAIYVDTGGGPGTMVEYVQLSADALSAFASMRAAAAHWDGSDPVRLR